MRDTEELKEHPFFTSIDWKALALKQVTPPFKPSVESDESTANFDPEFTEADLKEQGIDFDDEEGDEISDTLDQLTLGNTASNKDSTAVSSDQSPPTSQHYQKPPAGKTIQAKAATGSSPITSSVQENFRGFTYTGESVMNQAAGLLGKEDPWNEGSEDEVDVDGSRVAQEDDGDDDWEDADDAPQMMRKAKAPEAPGVLIE